MTTIPKVIHYCWFGRNPLPPMAEICIASWRKYLPDYEIKEWNEDNFDVKMNPYIEEAYYMKKYAFVSDFARFYVLYHHGGVYFDVDVELLKPIDDILAKGPFMGLENVSADFFYRGCTAMPAAGLGMAMYPKMEILKEMVEYYYNRHFISPKGQPQYKTIALIVTDILLARGEKFGPNSISKCAGIYIYPEEYFNPKSLATGKTTITNNTRSIHHYAGSWADRKRKRGLARYWWQSKNIFLRLKLSVKRACRSQK